MRVPEHPTLIRRMLDARLKKLHATGPILAASLSCFTSRCSRPGCRCRNGGPPHASQHLTFKGPGNKTRSVYVPKELLPDVRTWLAEHKRLKKLLHEIHQLSVALLRARAKQLKLRAGRP